MSIETARLRLLPMAPQHYLALIESAALFEESFGHPGADGIRDFIVSADVSPAWVEQLRTATVADHWVHGFAVFDRDSRWVIGTAGFKGPPDADGMVEIGYGIVPTFQGRGFATEAAAALVEFAFARDQVMLIRAHTLPTANASTRVLEKCGFLRIGEVIDPEDGPVWRWDLARKAS